MAPARCFLPIALGILVACLAAGGCVAAPDAELVRKFQEAQRVFDQAGAKEDYLRAAALYQQIRQAGLTSGAVLYNQGNAFMRAGQRGRAIACYRQALRYRPRDPALQANLRYALGPTAPWQPWRTVVDTVFFWQDWISYPGKFQLTAGLACAAFAFGLLALYARRHPAVRRIALGALFVALLAGVSAAYDWYRFDRLEHGVVVVDRIVARKGNATSYEPAFTEPLPEGTEFRVLEHRGDWLQFQLPTGPRGWITCTAAETY